MTRRHEGPWIYHDTLRDLSRGTRYIHHEGGSRSGKTYNIAGAVVQYVLDTRCLASVVRQSMPVIKKTVLRDYIDVMSQMGVYTEKMHNKSEQIIRLPGGGAIEFFGVDDEQKTRGSKRHVLHMNEANEISDDKRRQLWIRTTGPIIIDHNPTIDDAHWIVKRLAKPLADGEAAYYHSTYKDNPFLPAATVREIEAMQHDDPYGWQVFGLGQRGTNEAAVFTDTALGTFDPATETAYGVDFGYKNPFVVCEWGWRDSSPPETPRATLYCKPLVYATHITTGEAIAKLDEMGADRDKPMYCDSAEPDRIRELQDAGYNAMAVGKRQGFTQASYAWMKRHRIIVDSESEHGEMVLAELRRTRHKKRPGSDEYTDDVVKADDHVADTGRYAFDMFNQDEITLVY